MSGPCNRVMSSRYLNAVSDGGAPVPVLSQSWPSGRYGLSLVAAVSADQLGMIEFKRSHFERDVILWAEQAKVPPGTAASLGVRRQSLADASVYRWLDGTSVHSLNRACRCRPHSGPGAGDWPLVATNAFVGIYPCSWLRVSGTAKRPQIDQGVGHQLHAVVARLFELEA